MTSDLYLKVVVLDFGMHVSQEYYSDQTNKKRGQCKVISALILCCQWWKGQTFHNLPLQPSCYQAWS